VTDIIFTVVNICRGHGNASTIDEREFSLVDNMCLNVQRYFAEKLSKHYIQLSKELERKDSQLGSLLANYLAGTCCSADLPGKT
jgi:hypothetical protein